MKRLMLVPVLFVAMLGTLAPAQAAQGHRIPLAPAPARAIRHAPHPSLRHLCRGPLQIFEYRRTHLGGHLVVLAEVGCYYGTAGSPLETSAYGRRDGMIQRLYYLDRGRRRTIGSADVRPSSFSRRGDRASVVYDGYVGNDALCCPSRLYVRHFILGWRGVQRGPIQRYYPRS